MKKYARLLIISLFAFVAVGFYYPGFSYNHDFKILLIAAGAFALISIFVKPIINLLALPFNLLTFGIFNFVVNLIIFYLVSYAVPAFQVVPFHFAGLTYQGFTLPAYDLSQIVSALVASIIIGFATTFLYWIFK